jgi:hypothetical protein
MNGSTLLALVLGTASATAQIPDRFENLQIFAKDIGKRELLDAMRDFSFALGVSCEFCHVGEGGPELRNMDFASDDKEAKRTARRMLVMVSAIQKDYLAALGKPRGIEVGCFTCHHGVPRPEPLEEVIEEAFDSAGVAAAVDRYRSLRKEHYGSAAYDFGEAPLNRLGEKLLREGKREEAAAFLELNREFHPDSAWLRHLLEEARRVREPVE